MPTPARRSTAVVFSLLLLSRTPSAAGMKQPGGVDSWWQDTTSKWDAGWNRSLYKPFALTEWSYDDSTISKWHGLGFVWFLLRLALAVLMVPLDLLVSLVFLLAQAAFCFWGPTGQNIVYGVGLLVVLSVGGFGLFLRYF